MQSMQRLNSLTKNYSLNRKKNNTDIKYSVRFFYKNSGKKVDSEFVPQLFINHKTEVIQMLYDNNYEPCGYVERNDLKALLWMELV